MKKIMNYIDKNNTAVVLSLLISVGILLLLVMSLFFCSVKLRTNLNDTITIVVSLKESNDSLTTELKNIHDQMDEFTGMNQARRIQQIRLKIAADSALISYIVADKKGLENMIKLMDTPKKKSK